MERECPIFGHSESEITDEVACEISRVLPILENWCRESSSRRSIPGVLVPIILRAQRRACLAVLQKLLGQLDLEKAMALKIEAIEVELKKTE